MKLTILGCYSATPSAFANPTSQVLDIKNHLFLIDCGEGTQVQLRRQRVKFARIKHIFISHLHGDHFFGLPGLISTFVLLGREAPLHVYGPKGIKDGITLLLKLGKSWTNFPLVFHELSSAVPECIYEDDKVEVHTVPLDHRVYTNGFLFREKPGERKLKIEEVLKYDIDKCYYRNIKNGKDIQLATGEVIPNEKLTADPPSPKSYAFCSDTAYKPELVPWIEGVDMLYHESTFLEQHTDLAAKTKHSTAKQAAMIAHESGAGTLLLGHYSSRYNDLEAFRKEAQTVFPRVELAEDGKTFDF
ncbi:ribonuclease Z [Sinomicrobium weinanense]|uniref:Ribonuclease Z n=1 Tax=Sinomicrobium weinanense TaxID=2842200 RepID=A0A926JRV3_9FLAO|nr:ribonuclease Z [Sinomicrobium weinanense]MBC9796231.1 ribonuclease Z [Sinomicrobium weinanense]MBU3122314.1 ribonuclease Z [Sinomicrobium weinanense]